MGKVNTNNEIYLGTTRFPIVSKIRPQMVSRFPDKQIIGDYDYANENLVSKWIMNDQRGGGLIENMDISTDLKRYFWSSCETAFSGGITLLPLVTNATLPVSTFPSITNAGFESGSTTGWTNAGLQTFAASTTKKSEGSYSLHAQSEAVAEDYCYQDAANWDSDLQSATIIISADVIGDGGTYPDGFVIDINDGVGTSSEANTATTTSWQTVYGKRTLNASATKIQVRLVIDAGSGADPNIYIDAVRFPSSGIIGCFTEYNGHLYFRNGGWLHKVNSSTGAITVIAGFPNNITDMIVFEDKLFIGQGSDRHYWYMDTDEAFTKCAQTGIEFWVEHDSSTLGMIDEGGQYYYSSDPESATPTWTANGSVNLPDTDYVRGVFKAPDTTGENVVYVSTRIGLYVHDTANAKFYKTEVAFFDSTYNGYGACYWRGKIYVSQGLDIVEYDPINGTATHIGLIQDDGVAAWDTATMYITKLIPSSYFMYALMGTNSTSGYSGIYKYNGSGWHKHYTFSVSAVTDDVNDGFISSVYANRLWFSVGSTLKWITEQIVPINPKKLTGYTYGTASVTGTGYHTTPWFDGGSPMQTKLAVELNINCDDITDDEIVTAYYRTDWSNATSLTAGWTTLGSSEADGTNLASFASGVGVSFKSIQFQFRLIRGLTNTNSPVLRGFEFIYLRDINQRFQWDFTVDCTKNYGDKTARQLEDSIIAYAKSTLRQEFTFLNASDTTETYYVKITGFYGQREKTGDIFSGKYYVSVIDVGSLSSLIDRSGSGGSAPPFIELVI